MMKLAQCITAIIFFYLLAGCTQTSHDRNYILDIGGDGYENKVEIKEKTSEIFSKLALLSNNTKPGEKITTEHSRKFRQYDKELKKILADMGYPNSEWSVVLYANNKTPSYTLLAYKSNHDNDAILKHHGFKFLDKPKMTYTDPLDLIKKWHEYAILNHKILKISTQKPIHLPKDVNNIDRCGSVHCITMIQEDSVLDDYEAFFKKHVPEYKEAFIKILFDDKDEEKRTAAAYLLSYIYPDTDLVSLLGKSIRDAHSSVRNASMRVMMAILMQESSVEIPVDTLLALIYSHEVTDLNKSLYLLLMKIDDDKLLDTIRTKHIDRIKQLKDREQRNISDPATKIYQALTKTENTGFREAG